MLLDIRLELSSASIDFTDMARWDVAEIDRGFAATVTVVDRLSAELVRALDERSRVAEEVTPYVEAVIVLGIEAERLLSVVRLHEVVVGDETIIVVDLDLEHVDVAPVGVLGIAPSPAEGRL